MNSTVSAPGWHAFGASVRGASHEKSGQNNQDAWAVQQDQKGQIFAAVADGHGNARSFRSELGSRFAVECAVRELTQLVARMPEGLTPSQIRRHVRAVWPQQLLQAWRQAVRADLLSRPLSFMDFALSNEVVPNLQPGDELTPAAALTYGSTLLAMAITAEYVLFIQLGDGNILSVTRSGQVEQPLAVDPRIHGHATPSLCGINPHPSFRIIVQRLAENEPALILLATDGYANCYASLEQFQTVASGLLGYVRQSGAQVIQEHLADWLMESTQTGSGDDITAIVVVREGLKETPAWKEKVA